MPCLLPDIEACLAPGSGSLNFHDAGHRPESWKTSTLTTRPNASVLKAPSSMQHSTSPQHRRRPRPQRTEPESALDGARVIMKHRASPAARLGTAAYGVQPCSPSASAATVKRLIANGCTKLGSHGPTAPNTGRPQRACAAGRPRHVGRLPCSMSFDVHHARPRPRLRMRYSAIPAPLTATGVRELQQACCELCLG